MLLLLLLLLLPVFIFILLLLLLLTFKFVFDDLLPLLFVSSKLVDEDDVLKFNSFKFDEDDFEFKSVLFT